MESNLVENEQWADSEVMTAEDVSEYLRIAPRTVYGWAQDNLIPCRRIGSTWRFKRSAVEKWVDTKLGTPGKNGVVSAPVLRDVLFPDRVLLTNYTTKRESLLGLIDILADAPEVRDREAVIEGIFQREQIISTGLGMGLAVPHLRDASIRDLVMAVAVNQVDLPDYEAIDGSPVRIVCMVLAGKDQHKPYLSVLAALTSKLKQEHIRTAVLDASSPAAVHAILLGDQS